ncbi:hypothetical protein D3C75_1187480 [compost metagenome]
MYPQRSAAQNEPAQRDHGKGDNYQPGDRPQIRVADPFETDIGIDDGGAVGQQISRAAQCGIGP